MTAQVVNFLGAPADGFPPGSHGPCGQLVDDIIAQEERLQDLLDEFPLRATADPKATASRASLIALESARQLIADACDHLQLAADRERDQGTSYT